MKIKLLALLLICTSAHAEGPRIGLEFESEKDNKSGMTNHAQTLIPGWDFSSDSLINRVELLIEHNKDTSADSSGVTAKENKLFLRIRHDGDLTKNIGYYIRGGVGRAFNNEHSFNYAYIEPGLNYEFAPQWEWSVAYREINSIDSIGKKHVSKLITGPNYDLDNQNEFEVRYERGRGDKDLTVWSVEYVHKF